MLIVVSNFLFTFTACGALFLIWRRYVVPQPHGWIVTVGFLARALVGQLLFWVSYLELPVGSTLQLGDGLWFFARDALLYLPPAFRAASQGLDDIVTLSPTLPSLAFIQTLAFFSLFFGKVVSVALLLNLFAYLGTSIMVLRWSDESPVATLITVTAISLSPAAILWAAQPLKDTLFQFLVIGLVAAAGLWQRASRRAGRGKFLAPGMLMAAALFAVAGIRWYYALAALAALAFFLALIIVRSPGRRTGAVFSSLALLVVLVGAFLAGGRAYIPDFLTDLFRPATVRRGVAVVARRMGQSIEGARGGFDRVGGTTQITAAAPERRVVPAPERAAVTTPERAAGSTPAVTAPVAATATVSQPPPATVFDVPSLPSSRRRKLLVGAVAIFVPHFVSKPLGWLNVQGGRGLMWFADVDTLFFDVAFIAIVMTLFRRGSLLRLGTPLLWLVVLTTLFVGAPMAYAVSNFGTLFRLREMVFIGITLLPLVATSSANARDADALSSP